MKKHNTLKVVLITLFVFLVLSWIFPAAYFSSEYVDQGRVQMGLNDGFNYFMTSLSYFGHFALYLILVGAFYGVLYKIPAYRTFLDKVVAKVNSKAFLIVTVILLAFGVSFAGLQIGYALFIPLIVSLILLMGYDKIVAAMVVVGSMAAGLVGSTYAYGNNSLLLNVLGLEANYQFGVRFVILLVGIVIVIFNVLMYIKNTMGEKTVVAKPAKKEEKEEVVVAKKIEVEKPAKKAPAKKTSTTKTTATKKTTKSTKSTKKKSTRKNANKAALRDEDIIVVKESLGGTDSDSYLVPTRVEMTHKVWPFVVGFILLFILLVMAWLTWGEGGFGVDWMDKATSAFSEFTIFGFPIFDKLYGTINSFGNWSVVDMLFPMTLLLLLFIIIYKVKFDDVLDGALAGAKKALGPAFVILLLYTILVTVTYHPFQMAFYKAILGLSKNFNIATTMATSLLASLFNVDPAYVYQSYLPYLTSVYTGNDQYGLVAIISQTMYGFSTLLMPSSVILMVTLTYLNVSYKEWLKNIWKLLLELFVILLIIFIILVLI